MPPFINKSNVGILKDKALFLDPDVFSIDIDGTDYYITRMILEAGFRPKIFIVEYNAVFGPEKSLTIKYADDFNFRKLSPTELYFGASITALRKLFYSFGYKFITAENNGTNAFFVDPAAFDNKFLEEIKSADYYENFYLLRKFRKKWPDLFELIKDMDFTEC